MHYIEGLKWLASAAFKFMAFFGDHPHSYDDGYNGLTTAEVTTTVNNVSTTTSPQAISKVHKLQWWDVNFEWFMAIVGFGYYMDLVSIVKPQGEARDKFLAHRTGGTHTEHGGRNKSITGGGSIF